MLICIYFFFEETKENKHFVTVYVTGYFIREFLVFLILTFMIYVLQYSTPSPPLDAHKLYNTKVQTPENDFTFEKLIM